jgi:mannosyltransferase
VGEVVLTQNHLLVHLNDRISKIVNTAYFQYGLLLVITLLAAVLRFYKLGDWSFWIDEIFTINHAKVHYGNLEAIINNIPPARNWVPISTIFIARALNTMGVSEWSARFTPAITGVLSVPILYFPTKRVFGWQAAMIAALLLVVSPWHIYWSQNARFYSSLLLLYTLALFSFFLWVENDRFIYLFSFFLILYFAISERLIAMFILPVVACYLIFLWILPVKRPEGFRRRNIIIFLIPLIIGAVLEGFYYSSNGHFRFLGGFSWFFLYRVDDPFRMLSFIAFNIGLPLMTFAFFGGLYLILHRNRAGLFFFIGAVVPVVLLLILNLFVFTKDRYVFVTLTSWIILGAVAIKEIFTQMKDYGKILSVGILFVFIANAAGANLLYYQVNNGNRRDWKSVFSVIEDRMQPGDVIVSSRAELGDYYLGVEVHPMRDTNPNQILQSDKRFWFVTDSESVWVTGPINKWVIENAELIDVWYLRVPENINIRLYLYEPPR